jgi:hypothetical protein
MLLTLWLEFLQLGIDEFQVWLAKVDFGQSILA